MAFDFKKEYKELYLPKNKPHIIDVSKANFITIQGSGDPNKENGDYQKAIEILYALSYTLKMSYKTNYKIDGFYEYVVPPLESFWWQDSAKFDLANKSKFKWICAIRVPEFITQKDFDWAVLNVLKKKKLDCKIAKFGHINEGLCVQMMHIGSYDDEIKSIKLMEDFIHTNGYENDFSDTRLHHEIYISDPRKTPIEKLKTIIRHPVKKICS